MEATYGPVFGELLRTNRQRALDAGSPCAADHGRIESLSAEDAFAHEQVVDFDSARCCWSAIWLLYDFLDESHTISQGIATAEGSFWHGVMHRREGDFSNAKYWFRKVGHHPVYTLLAADELDEAGAWDPYKFVDACQSALRLGGTETDRCLHLQQREWEVLFAYCYGQAIGK